METPDQRIDESPSRPEGESDAEGYDTTDEAREEKPKGKRRFITIIAVIAVLVVGIFVWRYFFPAAPDDTTTAETPVVVSVRTAQAENQSISAEVSTVGTIYPARQAIVSSNVSGQILGLRILKDVLVTKGHLLATINTKDLQAQKKEAEAVLREARLNIQSLIRNTIPQADIQAAKDLRDARASVENASNLYERRKALYAKGGIALKDLEAAQLALIQAEDNLKFLENSRTLRKAAGNPLDLETTRARAAQAEQRINTLQTQIDLAEIRAPISGFVIEQIQFDGEVATAGGKILTIADTSEVIVKASFADTVIPDLKVDDAVAIYPNDLAGERMTGKVSLISLSTDPLNRATEVWVNLANGGGRLRTGGSAKVVVSENTQTDAVVVPNSAVVVDAANEDTGVVMVVDQLNVAHETKVEIGVRTKDLTQIVSGLSSGQTVIIEGNYALPDGTQVEIKNDPAATPGGAQ